MRGTPARQGVDELNAAYAAMAIKRTSVVDPQRCGPERLLQAIGAGNTNSRYGPPRGIVHVEERCLGVVRNGGLR